MANFTLFSTFPIFCHQSVSFLEKSEKFSFIGGRVHQHIFLIFQLFESFFTGVAQNDLQCQILPKSGLDWLQMTNFGHFAGFPIFSPKMWLRLTHNGQFHPIHNFYHLLPPKHLISGEISKIFVRSGGGYIGKFFWFCNFLNCFTLDWLKMTLKGNFFQKSGLDWLQMTNFGHFAGFSNFPPKWGSDWLGMANFTWSRTENDPQWLIFPPKWLGLAQNV